MGESENFDDDLDDALRALISNDAQLPDQGPPVNEALLHKLVAKQPLSEEVQRTLFRCIAAYREWNKAYIEVQLRQLRARN